MIHLLNIVIFHIYVSLSEGKSYPLKMASYLHWSTPPNNLTWLGESRGLGRGNHGQTPKSRRDFRFILKLPALTMTLGCRSKNGQNPVTHKTPKPPNDRSQNFETSLQIVNEFVDFGDRALVPSMALSLGFPGHFLCISSFVFCSTRLNCACMDPLGISGATCST